jgi:hypothetical protein
MFSQFHPHHADALSTHLHQFALVWEISYIRLAKVLPVGHDLASG